MNTRKKLEARIAELETALDKERRDCQAMAEWFVCESRGHATTTLDVCSLSSGHLLNVTIHGLGRASGGVAVVSHGDTYRDFPRYVDDLVAEWRTDACREIREAAELILRRRDEYNAVRAEGVS